MKVLKIIAIIIASLIGLYLISALLAPKTFNVQRRITINAAPDVVFDEINSFKQWEKWSPWIERDSTVKNTYSGPESGVGNKMQWTSKKSGSGSMQIMEAAAPKLIRFQLAMQNFTPSESDFRLAAVDSGTVVIWTMSGNFPFLWAPFSLVAEKMIGPDYERGLANLKKVIESTPPQYKMGAIKMNELPAQTVLTVLDSCPAAELGSKLGPMYHEIGMVMKKNKLDFTGPVMAYYYSYSPEQTVFEPAVLVAKEIKDDGRVKCRTNAATKAISVSFYGDYQYLQKGWAALDAYLAAHQLQQNGPAREVYVTDPTTVKDKLEIETRIDMPVK